VLNLVDDNCLFADDEHVAATEGFCAAYQSAAAFIAVPLFWSGALHASLGFVKAMLLTDGSGGCLQRDQSIGRFIFHTFAHDR